MTSTNDQIAALVATLGDHEQAVALNVLQRIANHQAHFSPFSWTIGIQYVEVRAGYVKCYVDIDPAHHNPGGIAHGGVAYTLIDSAMGGAFWNALERPLGCATLELKINYLRPVVSGRITATAELVEQTTRFGILTGRIVDEQDQLVALAQGTFAIIHPKSNPQAGEIRD